MRFIKLTKTIKQLMDNELPEALLQYKSQKNKQRQIYLKQKTMDQIRGTSSEQIFKQYNVLNSAIISQKYYNLKHQQMNRYIDIFACNYKLNQDQHSRIKINHINDYYINANQIKSLVDGKIFAIFSQAPVQNFDNFWEAVYYKNVAIVIMLCSFYDPHRGNQSEQYWPNDGCSVIYSSGKLKIKNIKSIVEDKNFATNIFEIQGSQGKKKMIHLHWTGWSDLKKPKQAELTRFQNVLKICLNNIENKNLIWIHCSAGIGRTGTLGGVIQAIRLYQKNKKFSIFAIVENMRKYRCYAVQTFEQYQFLYEYLRGKLK